MTENASPAFDPPTLPTGAVPAQPHPATLGHYAMTGPLGKPRSTGMAMLLFVVTFGIYSWYWYFAVHDEMKRHTGTGVGGPVGLLLAVFAGIASPFIASAEVGEMYERAREPKPVSAVTGLWLVLGWVIIVGPIVWFVKTNGALNAYWRARGAQ